ncbi:MAG: efflux RND transporter periplasmic adaptor subunit [Proteobacteria bacterium]|nr:efflux RND transporter periplasmic adaptor subunit [Pseudomonadota bacterium]
MTWRDWSAFMSVSIDRESGVFQSRITAKHIRYTLIIAGAAVLAILLWRIGQMVLAGHAVPQKQNIPLVNISRVKVSDAPTLVSITGTISARYDIPIGVEGDGGRVSRIYVESGDRVRRGQLLDKIDESVLTPQVASLAAALDQARAEADLARAEYRRAESVQASGALSFEEIERRKSAAISADAKVKLASAQLAEMQARLGRTDVRAPADGTILTRTVEVGQTVTPGGSALFRLSEGGEVELRGQIAEQDMPLLKVGQKATVKLTGISRPFEGQIRLLGAVIDPQTRLGSVRVALEPDVDLRPGAFAKADVTVSHAQRVIVPQTAVLTDEKGSYVMLVDPQGRVERRNVKVAETSSEGVLIAAGLSNADHVVTTAGAFLQEGERVNVPSGNKYP